MKKLFFFLLIVTILLLSSCDNYPVITSSNKLQEGLEYAYFEGQRDYSNGNIRIAFTEDSCWVWTKSPWDNGDMPIYNPSVIHSRTGN